MIFIKHTIGDSVCYENINNKSNMLSGLTVFSKQEINNVTQNNYNAFVQLKYKELLTGYMVIPNNTNTTLNFAFVDTNSKELIACIKLSHNNSIGIISPLNNKTSSILDLFTNNECGIFFIQGEYGDKLYFKINNKAKHTGTTHDTLNNLGWIERNTISNNIQHVLPDGKITNLVIIGTNVNDI